jgi:hypothetical protein
MPANYVLLGEVTLAASAASITLSNIPQTGYTDLKLVFSLRSDTTGVTEFEVELNNTNPTQRVLKGNGASASSNTQIFVTATASGVTSNTFANGEVYIPNYTSTNAKSTSIDNVTENNGTTAYAELVAGLYSTVTTAVTSIRLADNYGSWVAGSTVYLYGLAAVGTTPVIAPFASGGDIITNDGTYWIHTFLSSGTFTPAKNLTCDYLVVAGGGGGGRWTGGGGGAGGYRTSIGGSALSLTAQGYGITIGSGGAGGTVAVGTAGTNSVFSTISSTGGGGGGGYNSAYFSPTTGGSGGGGTSTTASQGTGAAGNSGSYSPVEGFAGGNGNGASTYNGGGGGGSSAVGSNAGANAGNGGAGTASSITGTSVTRAGGGGGGANSGTGGTATGGGGAGGASSVNGSAGTVNTGGGGGGGGTSNNGGTGGSGIVIVRYPIA